MSQTVIPFSKLSLFLLVGFIGLSACKVQKTIPSASSIVLNRSDQPQILFLNYKIKKMKDGAFQVSLVNHILSEGQLKKDLFQQESNQKGQLLCIAMDAQEQVISQQVVANPLLASYEYDNGDGQLSRKEVDIEEADFFVRLQLQPAIKQVAIQAVGASEKEYLINTQIN